MNVADADTEVAKGSSSSITIPNALIPFVGFWAPFLCGVKAQIMRAHLSHLFK